MIRILHRHYHRLRAAGLRRRAANIRLDLMLHVDAELSRERAILARAAIHEKQATKKPSGLRSPVSGLGVGLGMGALIPGAPYRPSNILPINLIKKSA